MTIELRVMITVSSTGATFTVYTEDCLEFPEIFENDGSGSSISEAIDNFYFNLPEYIGDEDFSIRTRDIDYELRHPYEVVHSEQVRILRIYC